MKLALSPTQIYISGLRMRCYQIQHMPVASVYFDKFEKHKLIFVLTDI